MKELTIQDLASMLLKQEENINKRLDQMANKIDNINNNFSEKFSALENKLKDLEKSTNFVSGQYDSQKNMLNNMLKKQADLEKENSEFKKEIKSLERKIEVSYQELNDLQQYSRRECVEIAGVPTTENENSEGVAIKVFREIGVDISPDQITACHRVPSKRGIPVIIAKMLNRKSVGQILANRKKLKGKTASQLGFPHEGDEQSSSKVFINESLTKYNKELYRAVREKAKEKNWKFTWTWNGRIFARKEEASAPARFNFLRDVHEKIV